MKDFKELEKEVTRFSEDREWGRYLTPKDLAISIVLESAEILDHFQWKSHEEIEEYLKKHKSEVKEEMADVLKYLINLSNVLNVDLVDIAHQKLEKDKKKYPSDAVKGGLEKYLDIKHQHRENK